MNIIRSKREFKKCLDLENFTINVNEENICEWNIKFNPNTTIFNNTYEFNIHIPIGYPFEVPKIRFSTFVYHPNIDKSGEICLGMLSEWKASYTILTLLNTIQSIFEEPNLDNPININAAKLWNTPSKYISKMNELNFN